MTNNWKIHYLGNSVQEFENATQLDLIWHLGSKFGGALYNLAVSTGHIVIDTANATILVKPGINELVVVNPYGYRF